MSETTQVTRSRSPIVAIAVWAAILAAIIAVGAVSGAGGPASGNDSSLGAGAAGINLIAPLTADPSADPSSVPGTDPSSALDADADQHAKGFAFGRGGPGNSGPGKFGKHGPGREPISIASISGNQLSLKTDDGWTRTIDATGATITQPGGATITVSDLKVGDQIAFKETRNADGTYTITAIVQIPPQTGGTVTSVTGSSVTITVRDGTTKVVTLTGSTTYTLNGKAATIADLKAGTSIHAAGSVDGSGNFTATTVKIAPARAVGIVTATTATTITVKGRDDATTTIKVDASTTYKTRGNATAALADIAVGDAVQATGTLNDDRSLSATNVNYGKAGAKGSGGPGKGHGFGHGRGGPPATQNGTAAPSPTAG